MCPVPEAGYGQGSLGSRGAEISPACADCSAIGLRRVAVPGDAATVVAASVVSRRRVAAGRAQIDGPVVQSIAAVIAVVRAITPEAAVVAQITAGGVVKARLQSRAVIAGCRTIAIIKGTAAVRI